MCITGLHKHTQSMWTLATSCLSTQNSYMYSLMFMTKSTAPHLVGVGIVQII